MPKSMRTNPGSGWFPDPSGRAEFRYWDGAAWISHVSRGRRATIDSTGERELSRSRFEPLTRSASPSMLGTPNSVSAAFCSTSDGPCVEVEGSSHPAVYRDRLASDEPGGI
jgi:hypothetical protein